MAKRGIDAVTNVQDANELRFKLSKNLTHTKQFTNWEALRNTLGIYDFGSGTIEESVDFEYLKEALEEAKEEPVTCVSEQLDDRTYRETMESITEAIQETLSKAWGTPTNMSQRIDMIHKQGRLFAELYEIGFFKYL